MCPKVLPICSPMLQKLSQNASRSLPGPPRGPKILFLKFKLDFGIQFGLILGPGRRPKMAPKSSFCKKGSFQASFLSEFCGQRRFPQFLLRFCFDFRPKIVVFFVLVLRFLRVFFEGADLHDSMYFTYRKLLFHSSRF